MRTRDCIDYDWTFLLGDDRSFADPAFDDSAWRTLDLPHDWSVEAAPHPDNPSGACGGFFPGGIGWYRKKLDIPKDIGTRHVIIEFDGVYMNSEVWCNGTYLGKRPYGYSSFCYDLTPHVRPGEKACIAVRVDNTQQLNSRWYSGSGIYRHVWLTMASPIRVGHWGTYVTTPDVSAQSARVKCKTNIVNDGKVDGEITIRSTLLDPSDQEEASTEDAGSVKTGHTLSVEQTLQVKDPQRWSPDRPALYTLRTTLTCEGNVVDTYDTPFGIRSIQFDANTGFALNGQPLKFHGVNEHHDAGCLGAAVPDEVWRRRMRILKAMGCNAIRIAHNPAAPVFLDLCDEFGFLVVEDAFDEWKKNKVPYGYGLYWDEWWERDLADMIRRDRNHPCIVLWSVGNEIKEVREGLPDGLPLMEGLREVCHREDPTRPMTCGCCAIRLTNKAGYGPFMDVVGYNGGGGSCFDYEKDHATYPDRIMFASEVPHTLQTRGVYRTRTWYRDLARNPDVERKDVPHLTQEELFPHFNPQYQSSYDNAMVRISAIDSWRLTSTLPFFCGEFRWTGFDYLGECYDWPAKSWNFGVIDLCGFPKDTYYLYQSLWTQKPMVHILPHWSWPGLEGKTIPVMAYSNCDEVELFQDGQSLGKQKMTEAMQIRWDVSYRPGTLKALGYRGGEPVAECTHETAGEAAAVKLECDVKALRANRTSVAHLAVTIIDEKGRFVPHANHDLHFDVQGPARLLGLENGDPIDSTSYKLNHRRAFHGMALAILQAGTETGKVKVTVSNPELRSECVEIWVGDDPD